MKLPREIYDALSRLKASARADQVVDVAALAHYIGGDRVPAATALQRLAVLETGQLWRDDTGNARICFVGYVPREGEYAVMQRCGGSPRKRHRPFLYPVEAMLRGDDNWHPVPEAVKP